MKKNIKAEIIADSVNSQGNRITTFVLTYPRFIHAELLTHRLFSRNAASSRAIPASKMIKDIEEDPFIPVAWQKAHSGMQGTEYMEGDDIEDITDTWMYGLNNALATARMMKSQDCTKQLVNRILEPYQWYTCIATATEYDNFFELRCPQYDIGDGVLHKSRKDAIQSQKDLGIDTEIAEMFAISELDWLKANKGAGEIHISLLAEAMWDSLNESEPKQLKAGKWHIPFGDNLKNSAKWVNFLIKHTKNRQLHTYPDGTGEVDMLAIKIATARCARISYLNFEGEDDYEADIKLYDRLLKEGHMSPFEHCARAMSEDEYSSYIQGISYEDHGGMFSSKKTLDEKAYGWSGNFRGFVQLRKEIE
tara:strand:- start:670 stop:1758 length:1089 start_codon:yes stop_codon:yes gene_type:complete